ncbi:MAG: alpha/beta fold hydrolase [Candidatus Margulisbacteria bacterium]|jgi:pimeloyl-ACP methyl ester carboxylesterase|nr:alpha/beta fold hydrolase [Candidatus Margulisiibacteriota bacterium]
MTIGKLEVLRLAGIKTLFKLKIPQAVMRVTSAAHFSASLIHRFSLGTNLKSGEIKDRLSGIHNFADWSDILSSQAKELETAGTILLQAGKSREHEAAKKLVQAALFYHYAQLLGCQNLADRLELQTKTYQLFQTAAPHLTNAPRRIEIPFGPVTLPGYLSVPRKQAKALVIFVNGANTVKEEFYRLSRVFLHRGYATLIFDDPGSGEAWPRLKGTDRQGALAKAIMDYLQGNYPALPPRTVLFGVSLGGMKAILMAAAEPRISGVVSVSPPFNAEKYFNYLSPLIREELDLYFGYPAAGQLQALVERTSLDTIAGQVKVPVFVAAGRKDTVLPYREAERLFAELPPNPHHQKMVYEAGHICLSRFSELLNDVLAWLPKIC